MNRAASKKQFPIIFNPRLESIRGLAALMVAGSHAFLVYPAGAMTTPIRWLLNGSAAVTLFFVLSGVVLGMGLRRAGSDSGRQFAAYAVRRVCRIYPAFFFTTLAIIAFVFLVHSVAAPDFWFNHASPYGSSMLNGNNLPTAQATRSNLFLLNNSFNFVTWTLGVELFCSLLLPLAHFAKLRMPASGTWLLLAFAGFLVFLGKWFLLLGLSELEAAFPWDYFGYFYLFFIGYLLPLVAPKLFATDNPCHYGSGIVLAVAAIAFLSAPWVQDTYRFVAGFNAWVILGVIMYGPSAGRFRLLDHRLVRFYGKISFSFYLLHDLILTVLARLSAHLVFGGQTPAWPLLVNAVLFVLSVLVTTPFAVLMHRLIELPFIGLGKGLAQKIAEPPNTLVPLSPALTR